MAGNRDLQAAMRAKKDDFYTQLTDIEKELRHYKAHFKGKVVYCNCDDPRVSNFFKFFLMNFEVWELKKLIATCYKNQNPDIFSPHDSERAVYMEYHGDQDCNRLPDYDDVDVKSLQGDGDFRSAECVALLKRADIVCTNPPFSKFREYVAQLIAHDKKFLYIGNMNAITTKQIFPLVKAGKLWYGPSISSGDREFGVPDDYPLTASSYRIDEHGRKFVRVKGVRWFTNLDHAKRHENLVLWAKYTPEKYPRYDNYDAINVDSVSEIPRDYAGVMGVPVTFLDKYSPDQFEIIGASEQCGRGFSGTLWDAASAVPHPLVGGHRKYSRIFIRKRPQRPGP